MPRNARATTVFPIALRELEVVRVEDITSGMRRVVLSGAQLDAHTTADGFAQAAFASPGFDDDFRMLFPEPGETEPVLPIVRDGGITFPKDRRVLARAYTVRSYDPATRELAVDFVKHGIGVATTWAYRARPGDRMHIAGPSASKALPQGFDWLLVAGDETALPAITRLLEELPEIANAQVFIEIAEEAHRQPLRELPGVRVSWLVRDGAPAGEGGPLLDAVRAAEWQAGDAFAWIAGEQSVVRSLRRHLVEDRGLPKPSIDFTGYWKRERVVALAEDAAVPDPERNEDAFEKFHEQAELLPPLAIRVAANLDIAEHISRGITTAAGLAETSGADERALGKLLRYLCALELLEPVEGSGPGEYRLTASGEFLTNEYVLDHVHRDGVQARKELAFHGLEEAVRTGRPVYRGVTGRSYAEARQDPSFEHALLERTAQFAEYLAAPLAASEALASRRRLVVHSNGAGAIATALVARRPEARVLVPALPTAAAWLRDDLPRSIPDATQRNRVEVVEQSVFERTPEADAVILVHALADLPAPEARLALRRAAETLAPGGRLLVIEETLDPEQLDEHEAEADLLGLALTGAGMRTPAELDALFASAGLGTVATEAIGWGKLLRVLAPADAAPDTD